MFIFTHCKKLEVYREERGLIDLDLSDGSCALDAIARDCETLARLETLGANAGDDT